MAINLNEAAKLYSEESKTIKAEEAVPNASKEARGSDYEHSLDEVTTSSKLTQQEQNRSLLEPFSDTIIVEGDDETSCHAKSANYWNDKENCLREASKYKNTKELQASSYGCYMGLKRNGWLGDAFPNLIHRRPNGYWDSKERCLEECRKYKSLTKLKIGSHGCYLSLKKNGWVKDAVFMNKRKAVEVTQREYGYWDDKEHCMEEASKHSTVKSLQNASMGCYYGLKRNGWFSEAFPNVKDWTYKEAVLKAALECKTKAEFREKFGGAYASAKSHGWMDDISGHFVRPKKYADYDSRVHVVYVYEIKELMTCYVGRTSNLHSRDLGHRRPRRHSDGRVEYDSLASFCNEKGIEIPQPIVKDEGLNATESLERENYWVEFYAANGWTLLNKAKTGPLSGSLGGVVKWDYDTCKEFTKNFKYKTELKRASYSCYEHCLKNGWFEEFGIEKDKRSHPSGNWNIKRNCLEEAEKYSSKADFAHKCNGAYKGALKNGWMAEVDEIIRRNKENAKSVGKA